MVKVETEVAALVEGERVEEGKVEDAKVVMEMPKEVVETEAEEKGVEELVEEEKAEDAKVVAVMVEVETEVAEGEGMVTAEKLIMPNDKNSHHPSA